MKHIIYLLSIFLIVHFNAFSQSLENIVYCHENVDVAELYFINPHQFVGHFYDANNNFLLLFNTSNIIIDTLEIGSNNQDFLQGLNVLGNNLICVNTLNHKFLISVQKSGFENIAKTKKMPSFNQIFEFDGLIINTVPKNVKSKHPEFDFKIDYNGQMKATSKNVERKYKQINSPFLASKISYDRENGKFYMFLEDAGLLYSIGLDGEIKTFNLPDKSSVKKSWNILFDQQKNKLYGLLFDRKGNYEVFAISFGSGGSVETKYLNSFHKEPISVSNNRLIYQSVEKNEKGKRLICYYGEELLH